MQCQAKLGDGTHEFSKIQILKLFVHICNIDFYLIVKEKSIFRDMVKLRIVIGLDSNRPSNLERLKYL